MQLLSTDKATTFHQMKVKVTNENCPVMQNLRHSIRYNSISLPLPPPKSFTITVLLKDIFFY